MRDVVSLIRIVEDVEELYDIKVNRRCVERIECVVLADRVTVLRSNQELVAVMFTNQKGVFISRDTWSTNKN